jgi:hypothetical protein
MNLLLLLSLQAAAAPPPPPGPVAGAVDFDLARYKASDDPKTAERLFACLRPQGAEIVVCGRRGGNAYPIDKMGRLFESKPLRAEKDIGGGATVDAHVETATLATGVTSKRVMLRLKVPF